MPFSISVRRIRHRLAVQGTGKPGFVKGEATIELVEQNETTIVTLKGQGQVGGLIARVGQLSARSPR